MYNGQDGLALIRQRLDRAIANHQWLDLFPKEKVDHITAESLYHCPFVLSLYEVTQQLNRLFHFIEAWTSDKSSFEVVEAVWKDGMHWLQLRIILFNTLKPLKTWNRENFGFAQIKIKELEEKLNAAQSDPIGRSSEEIQIKGKLQIHRARKESILCQKSKEVWLKKGDRNSKFFHTSLIVRRRRNAIHCIKDGQKWIQDLKGISEYFTTQFKELYQTSTPTILN